MHGRFKRLVNVIQDLSRTRTMDEVTAIVRVAARDLTGADGATFVLREDNMCFYADEDAIGPLWKGRRFPLDACISGWAMQHAQSVTINDIYQDKRIPADAYRPTFVHSLTMVPIRLQDPVGAIGTYWASPHQSDAEEIEILQALANTTAVAIENVQLYASLQQRIEELDHAARMKDEFLMTMSHELRTPLNAMLGWSQLLLESPGDNHHWRLGLETIEANARAQERIIADLLDTSRIISGRLTLEAKPFDPAQVIRMAAESLQLAAQSRHIALRLHLAPAVGMIHGDSGRLQQVIWNLLSNAIKFTAPGGEVVISLARLDGHARIQVSDNGEGIAPDFLPYVFERFRQSDGSVTRRHGGLGLGLAIAKHLVEAHGGSVKAESAGLGKGATFTVLLPLAAISLPRINRAVASDENKAFLHGITILAVDDDASARDLVQAILRRYGAEVIMTSDAPSAFRAISTYHPDLLLSDISMPGEDGYALMRRVRQLPAESGGKLPAIALTAFADKEHEAAAILAGFDAFLPKPIHVGHFLELLQKVLQTKTPGVLV